LLYRTAKEQHVKDGRIPLAIAFAEGPESALRIRPDHARVLQLRTGDVPKRVENKASGEYAKLRVVDDPVEGINAHAEIRIGRGELPFDRDPKSVPSGLRKRVREHLAHIAAVAV